MAFCTFLYNITLQFCRDKERHEVQARLTRKENELVKENMRQTHIKFLEMVKTIAGLEKSLASEKAKAASVEKKVLQKPLFFVKFTISTLCNVMSGFFKPPFWQRRKMILTKLCVLGNIWT